MLKTMGILMVLLGAAGTGGSMALAVYRSNVLLRQLLAAMELLHSELSFRRTPLKLWPGIWLCGRNGQWLSSCGKISCGPASHPRPAGFYSS